MEKTRLLVEGWIRGVGFLRKTPGENVSFLERKRGWGGGHRVGPEVPVALCEAPRNSAGKKKGGWCQVFEKNGLEKKRK